MPTIRVAAVFVALCFVIFGCGSDDEAGDLEFPPAEPQASDPAIPEQVGLVTIDWSSSADSLTMTVADGEFEPPNGGTFSSAGAIFSFEETTSTGSPGGQLSIKWLNPDDPVSDGEPESASADVNYGLSGEFSLEPGTYDVASAQTSDGSPWFNGDNDPRLIYPGQGRRFGVRKDGVLIIEEVTDTNMTGHLIITGEFSASIPNDSGDFERSSGTFRMAAAFNAYRTQ